MTDEEKAKEFVDTLLNKDDTELDKFLDENLGDLKLDKKQAGTLLGIIEGVGICSYLAGLKVDVHTDNFKVIAELEKENEELKADNDARKFAMAMSEKVEKQLREENAKLKKELVEKGQLLDLTEREWAKDTSKMIYYKTQLTKAKALLAKWVELFKPKNKTALPRPIQIDTEQFLKESEDYV